MEQVNGKFKVFVVDDDEIFLKAITKKLDTSLHCSVVGFTSGEQCLFHINEKPNMVLADYLLSEGNGDAINGDQLLSRIKKEHSQIPVLMYSSSQNVELAINMIRLGAIDFVQRNSVDGFSKVIDKAIWLFKSTKLKYIQKLVKAKKRQVVSVVVVFLTVIFMLLTYNKALLPYYFALAILVGALILIFEPLYNRIKQSWPYYTIKDIFTF